MSGRGLSLALLAASTTLLLTVAACGGDTRSSGGEEAATQENGGAGFGPDFTPGPDDGGGDEPAEEEEQEQPSSSNEVAVGPAFGEPRIFDFESVSVGSESDELVITVKNIQQEPVVVTAVDVVGDHLQDFTVTETGCLPDVELAAQETCEIALVFAPTEAGEREAVLQITVSGGMGRQVRLVGIGVT